MKKKLATILTSALIGILLIAMLCGCSTYGKVEKAFKNDGYEVVTEADDAQKKIVTAMFGEDAESKVTIHVFKKGLADIATVVEFKTEKEMLDELKKLTEDPKIGSYVKTFIDDIQNCDIVNGNCVFISVLNFGALDTFKKSK